MEGTGSRASLHPKADFPAAGPSELNAQVNLGASPPNFSVGGVWEYSEFEAREGCCHVQERRDVPIPISTPSLI